MCKSLDEYGGGWERRISRNMSPWLALKYGVCVLRLSFAFFICIECLYVICVSLSQRLSLCIEEFVRFFFHLVWPFVCSTALAHQFDQLITLARLIITPPSPADLHAIVSRWKPDHNNEQISILTIIKVKSHSNYPSIKSSMGVSSGTLAS